MKKITYQATLGELALLVTTTDYSNPELAENMLQFGVTAPIVLISNGAKSKFGMKKITVKDGAKRLNLAAKNPEIAKLVAQVILMDDSVEYVPEIMKVSPSAHKIDEYKYHDIYSWKNEKRNISEHCTAENLGKKYGIRVQYLYPVIKGKMKSARGWSLVEV
ncbi:hypothetical protein STA3757_16430 [Stanieria sp. NIES-3757]|nr:hypothetical protein STA3757_16430 [Stanieria sp. NIES-3757]